LENYIPKGKYFLNGDDPESDQGFCSPAITLSSLFGNDEDIALVSWIRAMEKEQEGYAYSLFLSPLYENIAERYYESRFAELKPFFRAAFPRTIMPNSCSSRPSMGLETCS
jgi:hypothetical protein